jgi:hypothetical protein
MEPMFGLMFGKAMCYGPWWKYAGLVATSTTDAGKTNTRLSARNSRVW